MIVKRNKPKVYIMMGPAGSGKSSWVEKNLGYNFPVISKDKIRIELGIMGADKKAIGTNHEENKVNKIQDQRIDEFLRKKLDFAIDNVNLGKSLEKLVRKLKKYEVEIIGVKVETPLHIILQRRPEIPRRVLLKMYDDAKKVDLSLFDKIVKTEGI